ncbi:MAG: sigma-70 family RNA polymerase sigma factor [Clostridia bacterium]|nr:sigma-70 family RNA polymerase sigma factor [Clostridia bacterium]
MNQDEEIKRLYLEMYDLLMSYAKGVLEDYALAEEAVQETFRIACSKPEDLLSSKNPNGWLTNTLKNVMSNTKRTRARLNHLFMVLIQLNEWSAEVDGGELDVDVLYANLTDDKDYQLLKKVVLEQRTMLEVSSELGISLEACAKRVQRAKKALKKKLSEN